MTPRIPIIVTSTDPHTLQRMEQDYDRYGGDKLVAKPLDIDVLLEAIRTLIGPAQEILEVEAYSRCSA